MKRQGDPFDKLSDYETRNLLAHLSGCGRHEAIHAALSLDTIDGRNAWYVHRTRSGTDADFQADVEFARGIADADPAADSLVRSIRYQLVSSSLAAIHQRFPAAFIAHLVRSGAWSTRQALDSIELFGDGARRANVLEEILPSIGKEHRRRVLALSRTLPATRQEIVPGADGRPDLITSSAKAEILAKLSGWFQGPETVEVAGAAIDAALVIENDRDRARSLGRLLPDLPARLRRDAAAHILAVADEAGNPARADLMLAVVQHCPDWSEALLPRIGQVVAAGRLYDRSETSFHLEQLFQALAGAPAPVAEEALAVAVQQTAKGAKGLLRAMATGAIAPWLVPHIPSGQKGAGKTLEQECLALYVRIDEGSAERCAARLASLRHEENRLEYFLLAHRSLGEAEARAVAARFAESIGQVRSVEIRAQLAAALLASGLVPKTQDWNLAGECLKAITQIRNAPPRFAALLRLLDSRPDLVPVIELARETIAALPTRSCQAIAWLDLAERAQASSSIAALRPWACALQALRSLSRQEAKLPILTRLIAARPDAVMDVLKPDISALDPENRMRLFNRSILHLDHASRHAVTAWVVDMIKRARDPEIQQSLLAKSPRLLDLDSSLELVRHFEAVEDKTRQLHCLGAVAAEAPDALISDFLKVLDDQPGQAAAIDVAIEAVADRLTPSQAEFAYDLAKRRSQPPVQASVFGRLGTQLHEAEQNAAMARALTIRQRAVRLRSAASVLQSLPPHVIDQFGPSLRRQIPEPSRFHRDLAAEPLISALSRHFARAGQMERALGVLALSHVQDEQLIGIARYLAASEASFREILDLSRPISNAQARANIQLALLAWRAKSGFADDALRALRTLDSYCMPIAANSLSAWLDQGQISDLLHQVDAEKGAFVTPPPVPRQWKEAEQRTQYSTMLVSNGYFGPTPADLVTAAALVPELLPRLVELGREEDAWAYLHYATGAQLANFVTCSAARTSDAGLQRMIGLARGLADQSDFVAAIGAIAVELAGRDQLETVRSLLAMLPTRLSQTPELFENRRVGQLVRAQLRLRHLAEDILPAELTRRIAPESLANYPRIAIALSCVVRRQGAGSSGLVEEVLSEIAKHNSSRLEADALRYVAAYANTLPATELRAIVEWAFGVRQGARPIRHRPRSDLLEIAAALAPAIRRIERERGIVSLYGTIRQICGWWGARPPAAA